MRPTRDCPAHGSAMILVQLGAAFVLVAIPSALGACGKQTAVARGATAPALEVVVADPSLEPPPVQPEARLEREVDAALAKAEPEPDALPRTWTGPIVPGLSFADAIRKARVARDAHGRVAAAPNTTKEAELKAWFGQAQAFADQASRMYAAAFHAPDAPREGRIDAIAEAAELDMTMARSLDDAGLGAMPQAWRTDPAIASTFEDVAVGPTRRWRDEARVLARQCVQTARELTVVSDASQRCAALRTGAPPRQAKHSADAGAGCACVPGDPLCSTSLGGWCGGSGR